MLDPCSCLSFLSLAVFSPPAIWLWPSGSILSSKICLAPDGSTHNRSNGPAPSVTHTANYQFTDSYFTLSNKTLHCAVYVPTELCVCVNERCLTFRQGGASLSVVSKKQPSDVFLLEPCRNRKQNCVSPRQPGKRGQSNDRLSHTVNKTHFKTWIKTYGGKSANTGNQSCFCGDAWGLI